MEPLIVYPVSDPLKKVGVYSWSSVFATIMNGLTYHIIIGMKFSAVLDASEILSRMTSDIK